MKYIISESKLDETITNYLNSMFPFDEVNYSHPYEEFEDGSEGDDENRVIFYFGDAMDDETIFYWYGCGYFNPNSPAQDICPTVSLESRFENVLSGYFGDLWKKPFMLWFTENFDLPVKTVD